MKTRSLLTAAFLGITLLAFGCAKGPAPTEPITATEPEAAAGPPSMPAPEQTPAATSEAPAPVTEAEAPSDALAAPASPPPAAVPAAAPASPPPAKAAAPAAAQPALAVQTPPAITPSSPAPAQVAAPAPKPATAPAPAAATAPATANVVDPGGVVEVGATKAGLTRVGPEECGNCHDAQFESWSQGPHASRKPPLDCEGCHGPGSEYEAKSVMKDPEKARAAGLVMPDKAFCGRCHKKGVNDDLMKKAHAHE